MEDLPQAQLDSSDEHQPALQNGSVIFHSGTIHPLMPGYPLSVLAALGRLADQGYY